MTRLAVLATLSFLLAAPPALAQDADEDDTPIQAGARALLFGINPTSGLTAFDGATLSLKWHGSATRATRVGLSLGLQAESGDDVSQQNAALRTDLVFLSYGRPRTAVYLYRGIGPTASATLFRSEVGDREQGFLRVSAGVAAVVGVEWPVTSAISLVGEYGLSLEGTYQHREHGPDEADTDLFGVALSSRGGRGGVSVYF